MSFLVRAACFGALILAFAGLAPVAAAKTILIIAPHPDDEALIAAGRVRAAVAAGDTVKIVVVTNGDFTTASSAAWRARPNRCAAAEVLGLTEEDVIFLGYPDGALLQIYNAASPPPHHLQRRPDAHLRQPRQGRHGLPPRQVRQPRAVQPRRRWSRTSAR